MKINSNLITTIYSHTKRNFGTVQQMKNHLSKPYFKYYRQKFKRWCWRQRRVIAVEITVPSVVEFRVTERNDKLYFRGGSFAWKIWAIDSQRNVIYVY